MAGPLLAARSLGGLHLLGRGGVVPVSLTGHHGKQLAWIFLAIIVAGTLAYVGAVQVAEESASRQAQTAYENQLASCRAGNPVREAVVLATRTAERATGRPAYHRATEKILAAPFVRKDGSRKCSRAVTAP